MKRIFLLSALFACLQFAATYSVQGEDWPGPRGDGSSLEKNIPIRCDADNLVWKTALPGVGHASPIVWGDRVFNDDGILNVIRPGAEFQRVASSELGEKTYASPAVSQGQLFLRGDKHLFCFGRPKK